MSIRKFNILEIGSAARNESGGWDLSGWKVDVYDFKDGADVSPWSCVPARTVEASGLFYGWTPEQLAEISAKHGK